MEGQGAALPEGPIEGRPGVGQGKDEMAAGNPAAFIEDAVQVFEVLENVQANHAIE
jgi:hypothetical protein